MKHNTRILWLALLFLVLPLFSFSQKRVTDSLIALSRSTDLNDSVKIRLYSDICWELMGNSIGKALNYAEQEYALAVKINRMADIAQAESDLGTVYNQKSSFDTALVHYNKALNLRLYLKQDEKVAGVYNNIAVVLLQQDKFKESLDANFKSLKLFEKLSNKAKQAYVLGNIGSLYRNLNDQKNSEAFSIKGLQLAREMHIEVIEARILSNLATWQFKKFEKDSTNMAPLDSALHLFLSAGKIMLKQNDLYQLSTLYHNLGQLYVKRNEIGKAAEYYEKSMQVRAMISDKNGVAFSAFALGEVYFTKKEYVKSIRYLIQSADIFKATGAYLHLSISYKTLSYVYKINKDYIEALRYHELFSRYHDSIFNADNTKQIAEMQTKYNTEKKDLQLAKNTAELKAGEEQAFIKNGIIISIIGLVILAAIAAYFFYRKKQVQQKADLDAELSRQKELRNRSVIEAEEKERIRIATDLHDGVGQLLSAAKLNLSSLGHKIKLEDAEQKLALSNAIALVDDSVKEVRTVSHTMMPNTLLKLGLASAVKEFITKIQGTPNLRVNLEIVGMDQRLEQEKETVLYRVIQELVANIIKHARASQLNLHIIRHEKELSVLIEDNGIGFDTGRLNDFEGIGLKNILSRIEFINGTVHFDSTPGRGTTVVIELAGLKDVGG